MESAVKRYREIIEPKLEDTQCGFRPNFENTESWEDKAGNT